MSNSLQGSNDISVEKLSSRAKMLIDLTVEQHERRPDDAGFHIGVIDGIWRMFYVTCLSMLSPPWEVMDDIEGYADSAMAWVYQHNKVRRYLRVA